MQTGYISKSSSLLLCSLCLSAYTLASEASFSCAVKVVNLLTS